MKYEDFEILREALEDGCLNTLRSKKIGYARKGDRFHSFKRQAQILGITPEEALLADWSKHLACIFDAVDDVVDNKSLDLERLREKFVDTINYSYLLWGLLNEDEDKE